MKSKKLFLAIFYIITCFSLQGCLLNRLIESKDNLCKGDIHLSLENGISVVVNEPLLYEEDIITIMGANPERKPCGNRLCFHYRVTKKDSNENGQYDIPLYFEFERIQGRYKLKRVYADKNIKDILSDDLVTKVFNSACFAKREDWTVKIDLSLLSMDSLPKKEDVRLILGEPAERVGKQYIYYYELQSREAAEIAIRFDDQNDRISSIRFMYFRYEIRADFNKKEKVVVGKLKNWSNLIELFFWVSISW
ncbi:hypothetical protein ACFL9T_14550 [Thermodesulfobacteriota bacterium]